MSRNHFFERVYLEAAAVASMKANEELKSKEMKRSAEKKLLRDLDNVIRELKANLEAYINQYDELFQTLLRSTTELEDQIQLSNKMQTEVEEQEQSVNNLMKEIDLAVEETIKTRKLYEVALAAHLELEEEKSVADNMKEELMRSIQLLRDVEIIAVKREMDTLNNQLTSIKIELEVLKKKYDKGEKASRALFNLTNLNHATTKNLNIELMNYRVESSQQKENIKQLLIAKDDIDAAVSIVNEKYRKAIEELKVQEHEANEFKKKIGDESAQLKHKQSMYDTVRSDRNMYHEQLTDCHSEINKLRRKFVNSNILIEQLKVETSDKDSSIVQEHFKHHSVTRETELLRKEFTKIKKQIDSSESILINQKVEIFKLTRIIEEAETERSKQNSELNNILSEKSVLASQVVKRNNELTLLHEKIKAQKSDLRIGESQYARVVASVSDWQSQLVSTAHEHNETVASLIGLDNMHNTVSKLEQEILKEQLKVTALNEEITKPINVHRWRAMQSTDPNRCEMISTIKDLQNSFLSKSENIFKHEKMIKEKEIILTELQNILARQPGPEIEGQIFVHQQTHKDKIKQLAALDEELNMYRQQVSLLTNDISDTNEEMKKIKKKWMKQLKN